MPAAADVTGCSVNRSRTQRKPKTSAITAPTISAGTLTTRPTRMHATPIAKPIGQRLGAGRCCVSRSSSLTRWLRASRAPVLIQPPCPAACQRSTDGVDLRLPHPVRRPFCTVPRSGCSGNPSSAQRASTRARTSAAHLDLGRPLARALVRALRRGVEADLPAEGRQHRGVVELVDRAVGEDDVALRVDVGADAEEDLLVVVDVDVLVDDHDRLREREQPEPPDRVHHLARVPGKRLRIETITQLWNAPAVGRS